ncbi:MAG: hypothetical protein ABSE55_02690 [Terracidiphilus sp.]|jgi:hypothetical protein
MAHVRSFKTLGLLAFFLIFSLVAVSQSLAQAGFAKKSSKIGSQPAVLGPDDPATLIQNKLLSQIKLTKATDDRTDIVTAGDIVALNKDGLMMCSSVSTYAFNNAYDNGVLTANPINGANPNAAMQGAVGQAVTSAVMNHFFGSFGGIASSALNSATAHPAAPAPCTSRKFLAGEKFWVTGVTAQPDGVLVSLYSDPYSDVRYYGEIKFFFPAGAAPEPAAHHRKGSAPPVTRVAPPVDDFLKTVAELITVVPADDQSNQPAPADSVAAAAPLTPPAQLTDIAPPPPPPDVPPPTIALGQTKDQVIASFGQPVKAAKLGVKEIYYYKEMKVTFTSGKVSNVD